MIDKDLIERGYSEYEPSRFQHEGIEKCFQKIFTDDFGKKYSVNVDKWKKFTHPYTGETIPERYEFITQFEYKKNNCPVNINCFSGWKIEEVEEFMEKLFQSGTMSYYERYDYGD